MLSFASDQQRSVSPQSLDDVQNEDESAATQSPQLVDVSQFGLLPTTQTTTVVTTTTVSTKFPPVIFKKPRRRLADWDSTTYPLKDHPTPPSLRSFTFELDGHPAVFQESDHPETALFELQETLRTLKDTVKQTSTEDSISRSTVPSARKRSQIDSMRPVLSSAKRRQTSDVRHHTLDNSSEQKTNKTLSPVPLRPHYTATVLQAQAPASPPRFDDLTPDNSMEFVGERQTIPLDMASPQSVSLPSPSASPITGGPINFDTELPRRADTKVKPVVGGMDSSNATPDNQHGQAAQVLEIPKMLDTFDELPHNIQSYLMYHLLKRCNKTTLQVVASIVNPALKRDFLDLLPYELSLHVLSYLDAAALCRAAQVSRRWNQIVEEDEFTWKHRLDSDQYHIEDGEFEKALQQNNDASIRALRPRSLSHHHETARRRSSIVSAVPASLVVKDQFEEMVNGGLKQPVVGKHVYKAIYKQHHIKYNAWMKPRHNPRHISFESHGRHVVTCLELDGDRIITGSEDANINIFDINTGALRMSLEGHEGGVWALEHIGDTLVSGSTDRTVRIWNMTTGQCMQVFEGHTSTVRCLKILPSIESTEEAPIHLIITGSRDSSLRIWRLPGADDPLFPATTTEENTEIENPYFLRALNGHSQSVRAIAAEADFLVSGSYDCTVRVWSISTGKCIHKLTGHSQKVYSVVIDAGQRRCISGSMDWKVKVWDLDTGACLNTLSGHTSLVGLLNWSHDRLVSAAADSTLRIWNMKTGECKRTLSAHTGAITCFQHDGDKVISGSDGTLKLWDIKSGRFCRDLLTGLSYVWQVKFDERRCVAAVQRNSMTFIEVLDFSSSFKDST